jgi:hypothetical protein
LSLTTSLSISIFSARILGSAKVIALVKEHEPKQKEEINQQKEAPEAGLVPLEVVLVPLAAVPHRLLGGGGGHGREIKMRSRS